MMRFVRGLLAAVVLGLGIVMPALGFDLEPTVDAVYEETTIELYDAEFTIDRTGDLEVVETLSVYFPNPGKHGIFRFWDPIDPGDPYARHEPDDIEITRDGQSEPVDFSREDGRYLVAKIGDGDVTLTPGVHVYVLRYRIDGVLREGEELPSELYWNLIPGGWRQVIVAARLTVNLPVAAQQVSCARGAGSTGGCQAQGEGTSTLTVVTGDLFPNTPVTVRTGLDLPTPAAGNTVPWTPRFDQVLGRSLPVLICLLAVAVGGALIALRASWSVREPRPPYPLQYAPPTGIGPAQAAYLFTERTDQTAYVASVMYAAEKGAVQLAHSGGSWTLSPQGGPEAWSGVDEITARVGRLLVGTSSFTASRSDVEAGHTLQSEIVDFELETRAWAKRAGYIAPSGIKGAGGGLVVVGFIAAFAILIWRPFDITALALVPGLFAVFGLPLLVTGSGTRRTTAGRALWSQVGGFHRVLSSRSSKERFDFAGRKELYTAYLPWAVALGCAEEWARKYRTEVGTEPPVPAYLGGYSGDQPGAYVSKVVNDFSSTVDSAISAYQATQSSSSSSGGGGGGGGSSGGGGGGGGGGGSW
jgi:uncharacterized membrane protein YgcG